MFNWFVDEEAATNFNFVSEQQVSSGAVSGALGTIGRENDYVASLLNILPGILDSGANIYLQGKAIDAAREKYESEQKSDTARLAYELQYGNRGGDYGNLLLIGGAIIGGVVLIKALK